MIAVLGATGFTGRLIARELKKKSKSEFLIAGRNEAALEKLSCELGGVESRLLRLDDQGSFDALNDVSVLINCIGPYSLYSETVLVQAIKRKIHYIDLTGEQNFIRLVYEKYDLEAQAAGIVLIPACAFEYALGDAAAAFLYKAINQNASGCRKMEFFYKVIGMHTSKGTRKSVLQVLSSKSYELKNNELVEIKEALRRKLPPAFAGQGRSAIAFPGGEALMLPRHCAVPEASSYLISDLPAFILRAFMNLVLPLLRSTADAAALLAGFFPAPDTESRKSSSFEILALAENTEGLLSSIAIKGNDPYLLTAHIASGVASFIEKLEGESRQGISGAISPSMIGGAGLIKELSEQAGLVWTENFPSEDRSNGG